MKGAPGWSSNDPPIFVGSYTPAEYMCERVPLISHIEVGV